MIQYSQGFPSQSVITAGDPDQVESDIAVAAAAAAAAAEKQSRYTTIGLILAAGAFLWWKYGKKGRS
jgi:hypothetical protein